MPGQSAEQWCFSVLPLLKLCPPGIQPHIVLSGAFPRSLPCLILLRCANPELLICSTLMPGPSSSPARAAHDPFLPFCFAPTKDKDFGKQALRKEHVNPPAEVSTSLKTYQHFTLEKAYLREDFFWAFTPTAGDFIRFRFFKPLRIERPVPGGGRQQNGTWGQPRACRDAFLLLFWLVLNFLPISCLAAQEEGAVLFQGVDNSTPFWWGHVCQSPLLSCTSEQSTL